MKVVVKICGITNIEDAVAAAGAGADAVGFMFYEKSLRRVSIETAEFISRRLPPQILRVGVFVDPEPEFVESALRRCALQMLQFHGEESPDFCRGFGALAMKAFRMKDAASLDALPDYFVDAYLLDGYVPGALGGAGETFNWDLAVEAKKFGRPVFLAGGLRADNVAQALRRVRPFGVDVSSGVEAAPGRKDHAKIRDFLQAVRAAE